MEMPNGMTIGNSEEGVAEAAQNDPHPEEQVGRWSFVERMLANHIM